ncbi:MAG: class I SAM-dependent methyltransferase [Planctomycetaceae bacterium]|nr:class I SAM-dependent methyltransferase [Planctomycetaceae bacterium]
MRLRSALLRRLTSLLAPADPVFRFELLRQYGHTLVPDYRFKWPQMEWWQDQDFTAYLRRFRETGGMNADRRWMLHQLLRLVAAIPGDTAECGVYQGSSSFLICAANRAQAEHQRTHHLFDSFEGLSRPDAVDGVHWTQGDLSSPLELAQQNLAEFSETRFHKGWIPETFAAVEGARFCFAHIDVDLYQPTRDSLAFFYDRTNPGGIILCDDYGFTSCPGATQAVDEFLTDRPEQMISLSGGGGFLIRGTSTSPVARLSPPRQT